MIGADALSRHILDSIIELSGKLDLGTVAEGVETMQQYEYLAERGVNFLARLPIRKAFTWRRFH